MKNDIINRWEENRKQQLGKRYLKPKAKKILPCTNTISQTHKTHWELKTTGVPWMIQNVEVED